MTKNDFYHITHVNIRHLLDSHSNHAKAGKVYEVFWWDEIPLGHRWLEAIASPHAYFEEVWHTIEDVLRFYCRRSPKVDFDALKATWKQEDYTRCGEFLTDLFAAYSFDGSNRDGDLSLIICTRNRPAQLKSCLDSLAFLTVQPTEVLVVDNAPDDQSTREVVSGYPEVKYILAPEKGLDRARNVGWQHASASVVAYTDDDVRLHKDWVWQLRAGFNDPRVMGVTGLIFANELSTAAQVIFEKYWSFNRGYRDIDYDSDYFREHLEKGVPVWEVGAGASMAFRRPALESTGGFDARLDVGASGCSGDSEMWYRLIAGGWTVHYTPRAIAYHTHRKDMKAFKRQIYSYLRGNTSSLLVQYQRSRHRGNLRHLFRSLPTYYAKSLLRRLRYFNTTKYRTILQEIKGSCAGVAYYARHRRLPTENQVRPGLLPLQTESSVSLIITTYNHGRYIEEAIASVQQQTHRPDEVIVVDDGSTDDTAQILSRYPQIKYIRQANKGLASARNLGVLHSQGHYIVFLDADDLLYPQAIAKNLTYFGTHPDCAFISGWHDKVDEQKTLLETYESPMPEHAHYMALLRGNYIGMHGAVMYRRQIFDTLLFDETLPACEDYDLYLRIAKSYPIFSHNEKLAAYRIHSGNMSGDILMMWRQVKAVLRKNVNLQEREVKRSYREGLQNWADYYSRELYRRIAYPYLYPGYRPTVKNWIFVATRMPRPLASLFTQKLMHMFGKKSQSTPARGRVHFGDLRRTTPLSQEFGYDRGGPVDRYYIEGFLKENAPCIRGRVLEIGDNAYTMAYGGDQVTQSDILFIDQSNPQATIIGDLSTADHIASDQFDCIILTQTLHLIYDFRSAIRHCHRILKPGGALLLTVPGITQIDYGQWGDTWYWAFTGRAIQKLLAEYFSGEEVFVQTRGNVLAATAFLYGLGQDEINTQEKEEHDPHYQVIITARALKQKTKTLESVL